MPAAFKGPMAGVRFGRQVAICPTNPGSTRFWTCHCDCGAVTSVRGSQLRAGNSMSCGCMRDETESERRSIHGYSVEKGPEYRAWKSMRQRCINPNNGAYKHYGARGITVCAEWEDFMVFLRDMGVRPSSRLSIERLNVNGNYEPANCVWADWTQQARNRRNNIFVEFDGRKITPAELAEGTGIHPNTVRSRIYNGWSPERARSEPLRQQVRAKR